MTSGAAPERRSGAENSDSIESLSAAAEEAGRSGDTGSALSLYGRALGLAGEEPTAERAELQRHIGTLHRERGETQAAESWYRRSLEEAERAGSRVDVAHATNWLAVIAVRRGDLEQAEREFVHAGRLAAATGERRLLSMIEQNLGVLSSIRGDFDVALDRYRSALESCRETGDPEMLASVLNNIGVLSADLSRWAEAETSYREAIGVAAAAGMQALVNSIQLNLAELSAKRREWAAAAHASRMATHRAREQQSRWREAEALRLSGMAAREQGRYATAEVELLEASILAVETEDVLLEAQTARELADTYTAWGRRTDARASYAHALDLFRSLGARIDARDMENRLKILSAAPNPAHSGRSGASDPER